MDALRTVCSTAAKDASELPGPKDLFYYANFETYGAGVKRARKTVEDLLVQACGREDEDELDVAKAHACVVDVMDEAVEKVDQWLREAEEEGRRNTAKVDNEAVETATERWNQPTAAAKTVTFHVKSLQKPQEGFRDKPDNSNRSFEHKTRAQLVGTVDDDPRILALRKKLEKDQTSIHPLQEELDLLECPNWMKEKSPPLPPPPMESTPLVYVDTLDGLQRMAQKLQRERDIAVDLENHSYRSFHGFVCLMQVSTRQEDFVVDTLALREHIGNTLGTIFSDESVVKVMHGANHDIKWLQRDFGMYTINLFDTGIAAKALQLGGNSLASLLDAYCNVKVDKRHQLSDWRLRPLDDHMMQYARQDTHYLLYIFDRLRQELLAQGELPEDLASGTSNHVKDRPQDSLAYVFDRSKQLCMCLYEKDLFSDDSYLQEYQKISAKLHARQLFVLAELFAWRDKTARLLDESKGYVMSRSLLTRLSQGMPTTAAQVKKLVRGASVLVEKHAAEIAGLIRSVKERAETPQTDFKGLQSSAMDLDRLKGVQQKASAKNAPLPRHGTTNVEQHLLEQDLQKSLKSAKAEPLSHGKANQGDGTTTSAVGHSPSPLAGALFGARNRAHYASGKDEVGSSKHSKLMASMKMSFKSIQLQEEVTLPNPVSVQEEVTSEAGEIKQPMMSEGSAGVLGNTAKGTESPEERSNQEPTPEPAKELPIAEDAPDFLPLPISQQFRTKRKKQNSNRERRIKTGKSNEDRPTARGPTRPSKSYNYAAAKASSLPSPAPLEPKEIPGKSPGQRKKYKGFDGFTIKEPESLRPGPRTAVQPSRGNRSETFGGRREKK
uniref:HRDC domain-containing protein n=1 Tax=Picocystis salinarum TaxID=88271 RepID=A0A7S3UEL9_9CHLO